MILQALTEVRLIQGGFRYDDIARQDEMKVLTWVAVLDIQDELRQQTVDERKRQEASNRFAVSSRNR